MRMRDRTLVPAALPALAPLPSLPAAFSRRAALFGAVTATGFLAAAGSSAMGQGMGVTHIPLALDAADAALIDFAGRTVALAQHQQQVNDQATDAQAEVDRWDFANRPAVPMLPDLHSRAIATDLSTPTHHVVQYSVSQEESDALAVASIAYKEARQAHKHAVAGRAAASNAPSLIALSNRLWQDLVHSVQRLADMEPTTLGGLAAKASVIEVLAETDDELADWWGQNLLRSVAEDAIRLYASSVSS